MFACDTIILYFMAYHVCTWVVILFWFDFHFGTTAACFRFKIAFCTWFWNADSHWEQFVGSNGVSILYHVLSCFMRCASFSKSKLQGFIFDSSLIRSCCTDIHQTSKRLKLSNTGKSGEQDCTICETSFPGSPLSNDGPLFVEILDLYFLGILLYYKVRTICATIFVIG